MANGHYGMSRALLVVPKRFSFCLKYHTRGYDLNEGGLVCRYLPSCYVTGALDPKAPRRYVPADMRCRFLFISPYRARPWSRRRVVASSFDLIYFFQISV